MDTKAGDARQNGGEAIEHLQKALDECREQLAHANEMLRKATSQDNEPQDKTAPAAEKKS